MSKEKIEFGDFQTPLKLASIACERLANLGISPSVIIEPTCGVGAFVIASLNQFETAKKIYCADINNDYLSVLRGSLEAYPSQDVVSIEYGDFFGYDWASKASDSDGDLLVLGNLPWVTNTVQSKISSDNVPEKDNVVGLGGLDAITGKANFDISEWMMIDMIKWSPGKKIDIAMMLKTAVARKILSYVEKHKIGCYYSEIITVDARKEFGASVDACFFIMRIDSQVKPSYDYKVFDSFSDDVGRLCGHRHGFLVSDIERFEGSIRFVSEPPQKWRSGMKHDASSVMELKLNNGVLVNGYGEVVDIELELVFPLLKGSRVGSGKGWDNRFVIVTQERVGGDTSYIENEFPKTWRYLTLHADKLDGRKSVIYKKNPRFSVFGVGEYTFKPWKIAICGLYKKLSFSLVSPIEGKSVVFDDTVYFLSFDLEQEALEALDRLQSKPVLDAISSMIFWDEKRPIKATILNAIDWAA